MAEYPVFKDGAAEWLEYIKSRVRLSSYAQYKLKLEKNILPYFAETAFCELSEREISAFYAKLLSDGVTQRYAVSNLSLLQLITKSLSQLYNVPDPAAKVDLPRVSSAESVDKIYDEYSFERLCKAVSDKPDLTKAGIALTLFTGLRIGELCALKWSDIDLDKGVLTVSKSLQRVSTGEGGGLVISSPQSRAGMRTVPITPRLSGYLQRFRAEGNRYFLTGTLMPAEPRTMQYRLRAFLKKERLPQISFSELRKLFIGRCISRGADIAALTEILGNASVQSTLLYCQKASMDSKVRAVELAGEIR